MYATHAVINVLVHCSLSITKHVELCHNVKTECSGLTTLLLYMVKYGQPQPVAYKLLLLAGV